MCSNGLLLEDNYLYNSSGNHCRNSGNPLNVVTIYIWLIKLPIVTETIYIHAKFVHFLHKPKKLKEI